MKFEKYTKEINDKSYNHIFDMIIKNANHFKRKRRMKIPLQYNKSHIDINNLHYEVMKIYKYESYMRFIEKRNKRINEIDNKKIKKFFNKIKHQTKCTTERVFNLMKFEDEF